MMMIDYPYSSNVENPIRQSIEKEFEQQSSKREAQKSEILDRINSNRAALPPIDDK